MRSPILVEIEVNATRTLLTIIPQEQKVTIFDWPSERTRRPEYQFEVHGEEELRDIYDALCPIFEKGDAKKAAEKDAAEIVTEAIAKASQMIEDAKQAEAVTK